MRTTPFILLPSLGFLSLVACNEAPSAPTIALQPGEPTTTDDLVVEFLSLSTDGDAKDEVTHRFTWFVDGDARDDLMTDTVRAGETTKGQIWKVVVIPNDGDVDGPAAEASVTIVNTLPVAAMDLAPGVPTTSDDLVVTASATDADDDAVTSTYTWTRDGQATEYAGATLPADATAHGETWTVTATPNDGEADGPPVTASVTIANTAPALASVTLVPELPFANETIVAVVDGITDADADSVALTYRWRVNGTIVQEGPDAELAPGTFAKHDGVTVEVVPNDGFVDGPSVTSDGALVQNSVPTGLSASVTPAEAYEATTLTCAPTGWSDADADVEGWTFTWEVNGTPVSTDATLTGASFSKADVVACRAVPFDGEESGAELVASAITVRNTLPVLAGATLSTTAPREADTISVTLGAAADDDGDTVTYGYVWNVNGSTVATTPTLTGARFGKGDRISVTVTPYDGTTAGAPVTTSEAVGANSPPVLGTATVTPGTLRTNDEAVANVSASDPDGDTVTRSYAWTVNGIPVASAGSTLDGAVWFDKGQTVQVTVTPDDGADIGAASSSASVTVANSAPTTPVVSIDPMDPSASDDLVCGIDTGSVDPDGDTASYTFAWDRDGSAYAGATRTLYTSDTVPASATSDGETWTCEVVAGDGVDESGVGSREVSVGGDCGALVLDGATGYATAPDSTTLDLRTSATVAAWVRLDAESGAPHSAVFVAKGNATNSTYGWQLWSQYTDSRAIVSLSNGSSNPQCAGGSPLSVSVWYHVVSTYNGSTLKLYVDGVEVCSMASTADPGNTASPVVLGAWPGRADRFHGALADVALYNTPLSATAVAALASGSEPTVGASLMAWWPLDEGVGTRATDRSGNGNHATLVGGATWSSNCR